MCWTHRKRASFENYFELFFYVFFQSAQPRVEQLTQKLEQLKAQLAELQGGGQSGKGSSGVILSDSTRKVGATAIWTELHPWNPDPKSWNSPLKVGT
jgi:hypothetical protein